MTEPETLTTTALEKPEGDEEEAPVDIRDLTMDEKRRLKTVVQIVKKGNPELSQQDDEIELDIDSLDIQTLWELYSFVTGYKESLSNKKEEDQGFGSERDAESAHNIIQEPATGTERSRVTESGKAIRMSSSPVRQENKAGGSSSSNSSSSDSGSSSSDSDSDSSSGRGSDTDVLLYRRMNCRCLPLINMLVPYILSGTNLLFRAVKETRRCIKKKLMFFILEETDWFLHHMTVKPA
ncbi:hypothetical protein YC2023_058009 [Brassica napus]